MGITADELLGLAKTASAIGSHWWERALDCDRRLVSTCSLVARTCGPNAPTQSGSAQRAAVKARAALTGEDEARLADEARSIICASSPSREICEIDVVRFDAADIRVDTDNPRLTVAERLAREILVESVYTAGYFSALGSRMPGVPRGWYPEVYRGARLPKDHPTVRAILKELETLSPDGQAPDLEDLMERGTGHNLIIEVGSDYQPKPLESWSTNERMAERFACNRPDGVPVVLTYELTPPSEAPDALDAPSFRPVLTSQTVTNCLPEEQEVLLLNIGSGPERRHIGARIPRCKT